MLHSQAQNVSAHFTRVLLPIWAKALRSGAKPYEVQRYVGSTKNTMKSLCCRALVVVSEKGSPGIVAIARVFAICRDVKADVRDQLIATLNNDKVLKAV